MVDSDLMVLLAAVAETGSISAAAKRLSISYRTAWDRAEALNNLTATAVLVRQPGGRGGGGTVVTEQGQVLLLAWRKLCAAHAESAADLARDHPELARFAPVLRHLCLRTSARNQFAGTLVGVTRGAVNADVSLDLGDDLHIRAMVTNSSAQALGLATGRPVLALVKAPLVLIARGRAPATSADNCLPGTVARVETGAVNNEVVLALAGGRSLAANVARSRCEALGLMPEQPAYGLFNASSVILAVVD